MNIRLLSIPLLALLLGLAGTANAKGCLKGAAVGGVAGHVAGKHGAVGAAAGCAVGHHRAKKKEQADQSAKADQASASGQQEKGKANAADSTHK